MNEARFLVSSLLACAVACGSEDASSVGSTDPAMATSTRGAEESTRGAEESIAGSDGSTAGPDEPRLEVRDGIVHVGGTPFIPRGSWGWPNISHSTGRDPFADLAAYDLDLVVGWWGYLWPGFVHASQPDLVALREGCEANDMYFFVQAPAQGLVGLDDAELYELFAWASDQVASSPRFLGYMFDEPIVHPIEDRILPHDMARIVDAIRAYPAEQFVWIGFAPIDELWDDPDRAHPADYAGLAEIISFAYYPVEHGLPCCGISTGAIEDFGAWTDLAVELASEDVAVWMFQQAHRVGDLADPPTEEGRRPDDVETRFMTHQALIAGARGVVWFPGALLGQSIAWDDVTWDVHVRAEAGRVRALAPVIAGGAAGPRVSTDRDDVRVLSRSLDDAYWLITVRESRGAPASVTFELDFEPREIVVWGEGRELEPSASTFVDAFEDLAAHVYVLR